MFISQKFKTQMNYFNLRIYIIIIIYIMNMPTTEQYLNDIANKFEIKKM